MWWSEEVGVTVAKKEHLRNGCREEIGIHMIHTRHKELW